MSSTQILRFALQNRMQSLSKLELSPSKPGLAPRAILVILIPVFSNSLKSRVLQSFLSEGLKLNSGFRSMLK